MARRRPVGGYAAVGRCRPSGLRNWVYCASTFIILNDMEALGILDRTVYGEWSGKGGDKLTQSINLLYIAAGVALFWHGWRRLGSAPIGLGLLLGLVGLLFASAGWSLDPQTTIREAVIYLAVVIGSVGIAMNLHGDEYFGLLAQACFLAAAASFLLLFIAPGYAHGGQGEVMNFRGIFSQKNVLGQAMAVGTLASLHCLRANARGRVKNSGNVDGDRSRGSGVELSYLVPRHSCVFCPG